MAIVYEKSRGLTDVEFHYCPGCHHGIIHKLVAESLVELGLLDDAIGVCPVGCSVFAYKYFNCDMQEAAHGRAPAVATGIKRTHPHQAVFTYQGDGDLASIGAAEIVHAAMRGEKFTTIFVNNAIYGMTGGQMAPTTLIGQKATTCQEGRTREQAGMPIRMAEMLSTLDGCAYAERVCEGHQEGIPEADERRGLHLYRGAVHLPHQLGHDAAEGQSVAEGQHGPLLSSGCHQGDGPGRRGGEMR